MEEKHFTLAILSNQSPDAVFDVIADPRIWWTGFYSESFDGSFEKVNEEFTFHAGEGLHYSKQKLIEVVPGKRLVWLVTDSNLSFLEKKDEWTGSKIIFDISTEGNKTKLVFTHEGLTPSVECYDSCAPVWTKYLSEKLLPLLQSTTSGSLIN